MECNVSLPKVLDLASMCYICFKPTHEQWLSKNPVTKINMNIKVPFLHLLSVVTPRIVKYVFLPACEDKMMNTLLREKSPKTEK